MTLMGVQDFSHLTQIKISWKLVSLVENWLLLLAPLLELLSVFNAPGSKGAFTPGWCLQPRVKSHIQRPLHGLRTFTPGFTPGWRHQLGVKVQWTYTPGLKLQPGVKMEFQSGFLITTGSKCLSIYIKPLHSSRASHLELCSSSLLCSCSNEPGGHHKNVFFNTSINSSVVKVVIFFLLSSSSYISWFRYL
jgi:hypothetical protein